MQKLFSFGAAGLVLAVLGGCGAETHVSEEAARERTQRGLEFIAVYDYNAALLELRPAPASLVVGSPEWTRAAYGLASALRYVQPTLAENISQSRALFEQIVDKGDDPNIRALAMLELARELELVNYAGEEAQVEKARGIYRQVGETYPDTPFAEEAALRLANTYFTAIAHPENFEKGEKLLLDYLAAHPDAEMAVVMWQRLGEAEYRLRQNPEAALAHYQKARQLGFAEPTRADNYLWKMAQFAETTGRVQEAAEIYQALIVETPRSHEVTLALLRLAEIQTEHPEWNIEIPERIDILKRSSATSSSEVEEPPTPTDTEDAAG